MAKLKPFLLDESKPFVVPFSYYGNDVNNIPDPSPLILINGFAWRKVEGEMFLESSPIDGSLVSFDGSEIIVDDEFLIYVGV